MCVKINNDELFCNAFPLENAQSMVLFLDILLDVVCTYYCVARVSCLVLYNFLARPSRTDVVLVQYVNDLVASMS